MPTPWQLNELPSDLDKDIADHVLEMRRLSRMAGPSQASVAKLLRVSSGALSRKLSGTDATYWDHHDAVLYQQVETAHGEGNAGIGYTDLRALHDRASQARTRKRRKQRKSASRTAHDQHSRCTGCGEAMALCTRCEAASTGRNLEAEQKALTKEQAPACLPVPLAMGDRQANGNRKPGSVGAFTDLAANRKTKGDLEGALAALLGGKSVLTPQDSAAAVDDLHQRGHAGLATSFDVIYGRDEPAARVIAFAHDLLDVYGRTDDATAVLRASLHEPDATRP